MLLGNDNTGPVPENQSNEPVIFDVSGPEFEDRVLKASMEKPVLVDFWAPWCGPCKQLMPIIESAVQAAGGKVLLAKVNIDDNQEIAAALKVQSVPTVFVFFQGQPIDAFQGVVPESQIKELINKALKTARQAKPGAIDIPEALQSAAQALAENEVSIAHGIYSQILSQDQQNAQAYAGMVRVFIAAGQMEQAQELISNAPPDIASQSAFTEAQTALELAQAQPDEPLEALAAKLTAKPDDHQTRFDVALAQFSAGQKEEAIENLLAILKADREWNEEEPRKQLLKFFEALGHSDPLTMSSRRKLSTILFS